MTTFSLKPCHPAGTEPAPDLTRWPGCHAGALSAGGRPSPSGCSARTVRRLPMRVVLPGGEQLGAGGAGSPVMWVVRPATFFHRLGVDAKIGFGEAYMAGDWTTTDLAGLLTPFAERITTLIPRRCNRCAAGSTRPRPADERNTVAGARGNIHRHYDLSNEMFEAFLDESMTYSSAWFAGRLGRPAHRAAAQDRRILDLACVGPDTHVLEIGTGWGALAIRAAQRGARVTTLTISAEQKTLAEQRIAAAGVADRVQVLLRDYREAHGSYDAVVSVEMIEAVGDEYWPDYFAAIAGLLRPGGRVGLQAITMPHDRMLATLRSHTWIHKYVFPGGQLLSVPAVRTNAAAAGLEVTERHGLGPHYARTLHHWRTGSSTTGTRSPPPGSTRRSAACGSSTSPTARPVSAPATSTCGSSA